MTVQRGRGRGLADGQRCRGVGCWAMQCRRSNTRLRNPFAELNCTNRETLRATKCRQTLDDLEQRDCDLDPDLDGASGSPPAGRRTPSQAHQLSEPWSPHL